MSLDIYLYGCGGHAKVILDILIQAGHTVKAFVNDHPPNISNIHNVPIEQASKVLHCISASQSKWIVAIGNNSVRQRIATQLSNQGYSFTTAIHPSAQIALGVEIAVGTVVMANAVINTDTQVGQHVIVNTGATIDHDCKIDEFCHIAPGCSLCGQVHLGAGTFLGVGTCVCPGIEIGEQTTCGAGSIVVRSLPAQSLAYGCPAKVVRPNYF